jgi:drug/metabolite transporter (DMT)-like permease
MSRTAPSPLRLGAMIALMIASWSVNFVAAKIALRHVPAVALICLRLELAAVVLAFIYGLAPRRTKLDRRDIGLFFVLGILGVIVNQGGFVYGLKYTSVGHSAILIALSPVIVLLLARLAGLEAISRHKAIGIALCFAGAMVLAAESGFGSFGSEALSGDSITFVSVVGYAVWVVLAKRIIEKYDTISICFFNFLAAAICLLPVTLYACAQLDWRHVGWAGWTGLAYMVVFSSVTGYMIYFWALGHMDASRLAATVYIEPILAMILAIVILGERPTGHLLVGSALILGGVYITEREMGERALPSDPV